MPKRVVIARRFNGPPELGQGGYACGLVAEHIDAPVASVSLRTPVPLETPLEVRSVDGSVALQHPSGEAVADGSPAELDLEPLPSLTIEQADAASARSPLRQAPERHPFPTCFGCGFDRDPDEALRIIPGPLVEGDLSVLATTWTPSRDLAGPDGAVRPLFMWAALDCPTGWAAAPLGEDPHVLARLTARPVAAPATPGEPHIVVAWLIGREGRKSRGGAAIYGPQGALCGLAEGLWIRLRDPTSHGAVTSGASG
jgi:hypothetical protein